MNLSSYIELSIFDGLAQSDLDILGPFFNPQTWVAGTVLFHQGDQADFLYVVVKGEIVLRYKPDDGPQMILAHIQPGGIFGWSAAMNNPVYTSGAACVLDSELLQIRGGDLRAICKDHPALGKIVLDRLAHILAERKQIQHGSISNMLANEIGPKNK